MHLDELFPRMAVAYGRAYRKHSAHARDDFYDLPKALHIFNHVKDFMQVIAKGGLSDH